MPRIVRHEATGPTKIDPATWPRDADGNLKPIFICGCGLSEKFPICDGTHKICVAEQPGHIYTYDKATKQVTDQRPEP